MGFSEGGNYDWVITNSKISEQNDVLRIANSETDELDKVQEIAERSRMSQTRTISFIYKWKDDRQEDIFNSKNLQTICNVEREVFKNELYKDYCYIKDKNCSKIDTSITNIFYPDKHNWDCKKLVKFGLFSYVIFSGNVAPITTVHFLLNAFAIC